MKMKSKMVLDLTTVEEHPRGKIKVDRTGKRFLVVDPERLHVGGVNLHIPRKVFEIVEPVSPKQVRDIRTIR